jgi:hypothetical protein
MEKNKKTGRNFKTGTERTKKRSFRVTDNENNNIESVRVLFEKKSGKKLSIADTVALMAEKILSLQNS